MLLEYIENLRSKSKDARKRYAILFSIIVTGVVVFIWIIGIFLGSYGMRPPESERVQDSAQSDTETESVSDMFNSANPFLDAGTGEGEGNKTDWTQDLQTLEYQQAKSEARKNSTTTESRTTVGTSTERTTPF